MSENLKDLLARIEGAAEGGQDIDEAVHAALRADDPWWQAIVEGRRLVAAGEEDAIIDACNCKLRADSWALGSRVASYSTSVDAVMSLVKRAMPGHQAGFQPCIGGRARGHVIAITETSAHLVRDAVAPTAPLAILGSLLKALIASDPSPHTVTRQGEKP